VWVTTQNENFYSEVIGSTSGVNSQMCLKGPLGFRACKQTMLYGFQLVCRGGLSTMPQLFMALFANDQSTLQNSFGISGGQLSYIDPVGRAGQRVFFPPGYAPINTVAIDTIIRLLTWDDINQRPVLSRNLNSDQASRIGALFVSRGRCIEPSPESNIKRAVAISEEAPTRPVAQNKEPPLVSAAPSQIVQTSTPEPSHGSNEFTNSWGALMVGFGFVAFITWISAIAQRAIAHKPNFLREVAVESTAAIVSSSVLYGLGVATEIKWMSVPILGGLFSLIIASSPKHT
jgi:hypothetical protein